jgi:hypothetical protein
MKIKTLIERLQEEDPESEIIVQWYLKRYAEANLDESISVEVWKEAVMLAEHWGIDFEEHVAEAVREAQRRIKV